MICIKVSVILRQHSDHLILTSRQYLVIINKKKNKKSLQSRRFCRSGGLQSRNERKRKDWQIFRSWQKTKKKNVEDEGDNDTNHRCCARNRPPKLGENI